MEYVLRAFVPFESDDAKKIVLILVLVEYVLRDQDYGKYRNKYVCLNPCFSGICSQRFIQMIYRLFT